MALQIQGNGGTVAEVDGTNFRAMRVSNRPLDYGALGAYRLSTTVALVATQAAGSWLFSFRWGDATRLCVINYIRLQCLQTAAATATIMPVYEVFLSRSWTTNDAAGTVISPSGNTFKKRTSMGTTLITDIRKSAVAAGITAGTRTLDGDAILSLPTQMTITTPNTVNFVADLDMTNSGDHPIIFAQNEGFNVRGPSIVFGAAGTANVNVDLAWTEVSSY